MALGELQLKPEEFWCLTNGELSAMIRGYVVSRDIESSNHRPLFTLMSNLHRRKGASPKQPKDIWPLDIDYDNEMTMDDRLELYKKIGNGTKAE